VRILFQHFYEIFNEILLSNIVTLQTPCGVITAGWHFLYGGFTINLNRIMSGLFSRFTMMLRRWWPSALTLTAVLWLTLAAEPVPADDIPTFEGADKVCHIIMMFGLAGIFMFDYKRAFSAKGTVLAWRPIIVISLCVAVFSIADEWAQGAMGLGRSADIGDMAADFTGVALAALLARPLLRNIPNK